MAKPLETKCQQIHNCHLLSHPVPPQPRSGGGTESAKLAQALSLIPPGSWDQALPRVLPSLYLFLRSATRSAGERYALPQEKSSSLLALPVRRGEPEQWELSIPIFLCHSAYFLIPKMKLQLHWMDVLKCKPPEMGKCWLVNCLLSPCSDAILYSLNFSALSLSKGESATCLLLFFLLKLSLVNAPPYASLNWHLLQLPWATGLESPKNKTL